MKNLSLLVVSQVIIVFMLYMLYKLSVQTNARIDRKNVEFQIVVEDSMITVWDKEAFIGRVKLQGQLDSLMVDVNQ